MKKSTTEVKEAIQNFIHGFNYELEKVNETIAKNFQYAFEWGYLEKKYSLEYKVACLQSYINDVDSALLEDALNNNIDYITDTLLNRTIYNKSTSDSANKAHELKIMADRELLVIYKSLVK